jgi:mannose-6-phosphate isomerase-like protein (cupin superfamily)
MRQASPLEYGAHVTYAKRKEAQNVAPKENKKIFIGPDEGAYLPVLDVTHKVTAESFGGAFTIIKAALPPGEMIPPHTHTREDECNFVLEGELTLDVGGEIVVAPVGSFVVKPREVYHALCNTGTEPVRFLEIHTPGEFENYYDEYEEIVESAMSEDERRKARTELGERYGVSWHDELIPEVRARFGIGP